MSDDGTPYILVTGSSGLIGRALVAALWPKHAVLSMSRSRSPHDREFVEGAFHSLNDLGRLDRYRITACVHLAAVRGGISEEEAWSVNVLGTARLIRYLLDKGCHKFILASSIAAVGCVDPSFIPSRIPIPADEPSAATDAYGQSKYMMEQLAMYFARTNPDADFASFRIGNVFTQPAPDRATTSSRLVTPFVQLARVELSCVVDALGCAIVSPPDPGAKVYNLVDKRAYCAEPVADVLRALFGDRIEHLDLAAYEVDGHRFDSLYSTEGIQAYMRKANLNNSLQQLRS